uniref:Uncharacterized protein n=1 Tax=Hyaloperonospora arabidopsidis (strain Emoy2) TaxID=559515 RepID=M4BK99_HYAAE
MVTGLDLELNRKSQLTTDVAANDDCRCVASSSRYKNAAVGARSTIDDDPHHQHIDLVAESDGGATARERLVEDKLARVLVDLASEQHNVCLAANAGNALLEELAAVRKELDSVQDILEAVQLERDEVVRETQRLYDRNVAMETALQRYNVPYESWNMTGAQNVRNPEQQMQQQPPSLTSCRSGSTAASCEQCATRRASTLQLEQRVDEVNRRCLQSELACEREQLRRRQLEDEITQLQQHNKQQSLELLRAQTEREFLTAQLEQQTKELEGMQAGRHTLRRTLRRLEAENVELQANVTARDDCIQKLDLCKARATTQLQIAENRTASAQAETERVTKTFEQFQRQLMQALEQQRERKSSSGGVSDRVDMGELCESEIMEQLLQDATREVAALRLKNRVLRHQHSSGGSSTESEARVRRHKTLSMDDRDSFTLTAANVLALDSRLTSHAAESEDEHRVVQTHEKQLGIGSNGDSGFPTRAPSLVSRSSEPSSPSDTNNNCSSFDTHERDPEKAGRLVTVSDNASARDRRPSVKESSRAIIELPPSSPLYFSLSFIACATAATAASLLVRR